MLAETAALAAVGAFIALLAVAVVQPIGSASNLEAIAVVTGAVIGIIVRRLLRH